MEKHEQVDRPYWLSLPATENTYGVVVIRSNPAQESFFSVYDRAALEVGEVVLYGYIRASSRSTRAGKLYWFDCMSPYTRRVFGGSRHDVDAVGFLICEKRRADNERRDTA